MASRRNTVPPTPRRNVPFSSLCLYGAGAGIMGVVAMTVGEKVEQFFTGRQNSLVPGYTLQRLLGLAPRTQGEMWSLNMAMHYGQGAVAGVIRGIMTLNGVRGPIGDFVFIGVRYLLDQSLEVWTGVGDWPWNWPVNEQVIDLIHKAIFAFATGYFADNWLR